MLDYNADSSSTPHPLLIDRIEVCNAAGTCYSENINFESGDLSDDGEPCDSGSAFKIEEYGTDSGVEKPPEADGTKFLTGNPSGKSCFKLKLKRTAAAGESIQMYYKYDGDDNDFAVELLKEGDQQIGTPTEPAPPTPITWTFWKIHKDATDSEVVTKVS